MARPKRVDATSVATQPSPGPLAVWRLPISVGAAAAFTGMPLIDALTTNQHLDLALGRSFGAAFFVWLATGRVNHILADADTRRVDRDNDGSDPDPPVEARHPIRN